MIVGTTLYACHHCDYIANNASTFLIHLSQGHQLALYEEIKKKKGMSSYQMRFTSSNHFHNKNTDSVFDFW